MPNRFAAAFRSATATNSEIRISSTSPIRGLSRYVCVGGPVEIGFRPN
jgi:hypothetical protein